MNLNLRISPLYQSIRSFRDNGIPSGAGDEFYLAPVYDQILVHYAKLMDAYQAEEKEK